MSGYDKKKDPLPKSNAEAQVKFWQGDLEQAVKYLNYVKTFAKYNLPNYQNILGIAQTDAELSRLRLEQAKAKLKESK